MVLYDEQVRLYRTKPDEVSSSMLTVYDTNTGDVTVMTVDEYLEVYGL